MYKNNVLIRRAKQEDLKQITAIYNWAVMNTVATFDLEERTQSKAQDWYLLHQEDRYPIYILENTIQQCEIMGWGSISAFNSRPAYNPTGEFSIYISPNELYKGYGTLLLKKLCEVAQEKMFHSLMGLICSENRASLKLASKFDFQRVGLYKEVGFKFNRWLDLVVVQKSFRVH